jgi:dTDP-4-dehydrorhamnose reductase
MLKRPAYLVVGGDSLVGSSLLESLNKLGHKTYVTTRRINTLTASRIFFDFEKVDEFNLPVDVGFVYVVAAVTNYDRCEKDPNAYKLNVECIPRLINSLLSKGIFVVFLSTNTVFGGELAWPNEEELPNPIISYAKQKYLAETAITSYAQLIRAEQHLSIVRLSKVLAMETAPIPEWISEWTSGCPIKPFSDLIFAPISAKFVGESLARIGELKVPGYLHLSGAENLNYVDFSLVLAKHLLISETLIEPSSSTIKNLQLIFKPRYSGLGMKRTTLLTGIKPQIVNDVLSDLIEPVA